MKSKKLIAFILCVSMIIASCCVPSYAADGKDTNTPFFINILEEFTGIFINYFAKLFVGNTDETAIPSATVNPHSWVEYNCEPIDNPEQTMNAETWVANEISFESEKTYENPFNDVDVELHLWGNGRLYKIPAFWDGGNVWKVRFVCPSEGNWHFKTVCTDAENTSLDGRTGAVICNEYSGELDIYKHGFVTTNAGKKYFTYDDGTPFFYLGDTAWEIFHKLNREELQLYF